VLTFPWGLFAVLVGTLLPFSVLVRSTAQIAHDRHLGFYHTLNLYRTIKALLVIPFLAIIGPAGFYLLFGGGDPEMASRIIKFLSTTRGFITTGALLGSVLMIDVFRPRLTEQLSRVPISTAPRSPVQFRNDTAVLLICIGVALTAALFAPTM